MYECSEFESPSSVGSIFFSNAAKTLHFFCPMQPRKQMQEEAPSRGTEHNQRISADIFSVLTFLSRDIVPPNPGSFSAHYFCFPGSTSSLAGDSCCWSGLRISDPCSLSLSLSQWILRVENRKCSLGLRIDSRIFGLIN